MASFIVNKIKIKKNINRLEMAFRAQGLDFKLFYSVKTNYAKQVLVAVKESHSQYEILSDFEWQLVKEFKPQAVVLNGPAKNINLVEDILENVNTLYFNIDNDSDFEIIKNISPDSKNKLKIGLRIYLNADGVWNRFGYDISSQNFLDKVKELKEQISGIHFHFSTNNFKIPNYQLLLMKIRGFLDEAKIKIEYLDIGGGLPGANEFIFEQEIYQKLPKLISETFPKIRILSEVGRNVVADAVDLETKIISLKKIGEGKFQVNIDANVLHFPCVFEKKFWVEYITNEKKIKKPTEIEIYGNSCMQIDKITDSTLIEQEPLIGDRIIIHNVGAYSISQAANFISQVPKVITNE